jgi:hypothetical protein
LANGVLFGNKEKFMIVMNDFLVNKKEDMRNYLLSITDKEFSSSGTKSSTCFNIIVTREEIRVVHESDINLDKYEQQDLVKLHKLFLESAKDIVSFFLVDGAKQVRDVNETMNDCLKAMELARDLGAEPSDEAAIVESMSTAIYRIKERGTNFLLQISNSYSRQFYSRITFLLLPWKTIS